MKKEIIFALAIILIVATGLRLYGLSKESLWNDEAFSISDAGQEQFSQVILKVAETEAAPPLYYVFLHYWTEIFGTSEISIRLPSVIFSLISIFLLYRLVSLFFSSKVALLSTLFFATSMLQVQFSQEARLYSLYTALALLSTFFFAKIYLTGTKKYYWGYFISLVLVVYTNYLGIFLAAGHLLILFFHWKKNKILFKNVLLLQAMVLLVSLPLLRILLWQFRHLNDGLTEALISRNLPVTLASLGLFFYTLPFFLVLAVILLALVLRKRLQKLIHYKYPNWLFVFFVFFFGIIYLYLCFNPLHLLGLPLTRKPITNSYFLIRHSLFLVPLFYVFLSFQIFSLRSKKMASALVLFLFLVNSIALTSYYLAPTKPEWREATAFIAHQSSPNQSSDTDTHFILLDSAGISNTYLLNYYYPGNFTLLKLTWDERWDKIDDDYLLSLLQQKEEFWLILTRSAVTKEHYKEVLDKDYSRNLEKEFYQIKVYHYRNKKE